MGTVEGALQRIPIGSVGALAVARDQFHPIVLLIYSANRVVLGVDEIDVVVHWIEGDALGPVECGEEGRATIAGETFFAAPGDVDDFSGRAIQFEHLVALARGEPEVARAIEIE